MGSIRSRTGFPVAKRKWCAGRIWTTPLRRCWRASRVPPESWPAIAPRASLGDVVTKSFALLDEGFRDFAGHHGSYDLPVCISLIARGVECDLFVHREAGFSNVVHGPRVVPV